jgi:phosphoserine phosphatase
MYPQIISNWKIACFDLDGTLVSGTSTGQHLAEKIGHAQEMATIMEVLEAAASGAQYLIPIKSGYSKPVFGIG